MLKFICYPKCTTCQKARKWLDENNIEYEFRDIKLENPSLEELTAWYKLSTRWSEYRKDVVFYEEDQPEIR